MSAIKSSKINHFQDLLLSIWIIIVSIIFTAIFPFIIVFIVIPVKLYSNFINYLAYISHLEIGDMLTGIRAAQIRDFDELHEKPRTTEVACLRLKGPLDYERIVDAFFRRVVTKMDPNKAYHKLQYPELRQYFTKFLGYVFLKPDDKFDVRNHFVIYENSGEPVNRKKLMQIWEELMVKPFVKNKSPWEMTLIDNYVPDKDEVATWNATESLKTTEEKYWVVLIRIHHGLADGFSVQKMLSYLADEEFIPNFSAKISPLQSVLMGLRAVILGPYDIVWRWFRGREDFHHLHLHPSKQSGEFYVIESKLISTNVVKSIKKKFGAPFTAVLVAAISGGLRKYMLKYNKPIPKYMSTAIPFATLDHSDKLTNEFLLATVEYAVNVDDPKERVKYVQEKMKLLSSTSWIKMFNLIVDVSGTFPLQFFRFISSKQIFSSTYSTQPGPENCLQSFGATLLEVNYSYGCGPDSATFGISTLTYNGHFRMVLFIDKNALDSRDAAEDITKFISEEFDVLQYYPNDPKVVAEEKRKSDWLKSIKND